MRYKMSKVGGLLLAGALVLSGCASAQEAAPSEGRSDKGVLANSDENSEAVGETRLVTDHADKQVEIPNEIGAVAFEQIPLVATYVAYFDGEAPNMVAASDHLTNMMDETVLADIAPEALDVDTSFDSDGVLNAETLLNLKPDVVFNNARNEQNRAALEAVGLPVVGFDTLGAPTDTYVRWLRLLEDVYNEPGKNDAKLAYGEELINDAESRAAQIPDDEKRSVAVVMQAKPGMLVVAGGQEGWFTESWADTMNFVSVTSGAQEGAMPVNAEQLLEWDPDVILVTGKGMSSMTAAEILENQVDGIDLSALTAVRNGDVYSTELGMWNWFTPGPDAPVVANWLGSVLYPDRFADVDLVAMTRDYYAQMYGYELSQQRAIKIVDPDVDFR